MKIRWKLLLSILFGILALNAVLHLAARQELLPFMRQLEDERAQKELQLGLDDLYGLVNRRQRIANDLAEWDDTYAFIDAPSRAYIDSNLLASTYANFRFNLLMMVNSRGEVVHGGFYDDHRGELMPVAESLQGELLQVGVLWDFAKHAEGIAGFYRVGDQVYALASEPIVTSTGQGPVRGGLLLGSLLDQEVLDRFSRDWGHELELRLLPYHESKLSAHVEESIRPEVKPLDRETLKGKILVRDILQRPLLELRTDFKRGFYSHSLTILNTLLHWNLAICLLFGAVLYIVVSKALRSREQGLKLNAKYAQLSQEFEGILDGIPNPLMLVSPRMKVLWANRAGAELFGNTHATEHGKYMAEIDFASGLEIDSSPVELCLVTKQAQFVETELEDGRVVEDYGYPLLDDEGEVRAVIRLLVDISEKTNLRREANQQSRLASIGELAAGVAHEINNPTGMLLMNLNLLNDVHADLEPILDDYRERNPDFELGRIPYPVLRNKIPYLLDEMIQGGQRIKRIVEDLKGFARTDGGTEQETVDLNEVARAAARLVDYQLNKATASFTLSCSQEPLFVVGQFRRLEQIVVNLLVNATQALDSREAGISLVTRLGEDGRWVTLEVRDQGHGIDAALLDKVTDPFFTTRRNDGGTGLGLSLSARIAEEHGGTLRITSKIGEGTLVILLLPNARRNDESESISETSDTAGR